MPIRRSELESHRNFILAEMEIIQKVLDKFDNWIVDIRKGVVFGIAALVPLSLVRVSVAPSVERILLLSGGLIIASWIAEALLRIGYQQGYLRRREKIEEFLNGKATDLWLFDPKDSRAPTRLTWSRLWRTFCKPNTLIFHAIIFALSLACALALAGTGASAEVFCDNSTLSAFSESSMSQMQERRHSEREVQLGQASKSESEVGGAERAGQLESERKRGYESVTLEDFELDKRKLSRDEATVVVEGMYINAEGADFVVAIPGTTPPPTLVLGLLVEDAPREVRKTLLRSQGIFRIMGRAVPCTWSGSGREFGLALRLIKDVCLAVEDAWGPTKLRQD